ncbi:MAG: tetratricopeptide repeat protein [Bacteroidia bacterium]
MKKIIVIAIISLVSINLIAQTLAEGLRALDFEKFELAKSNFSKLTQQDPSNPEYYYYLGQANYNLLNNEEAKVAYEKGISVKPEFGQNYAGLGQLLLDAEKVNDAKAMFNKALSFSKKKQGYFTDMNLVAIVIANMVSTETKLLNEAEELVVKQYEFDKKNYDFLVAAGDVYLEKNDGGKAATFYERAIAIDPNRPKAYSRVAAIWLRVKNFEAAQNDLNKAFEKDPVYAPALKYQAELYYSQRNFSKAKEFYQKYLDNSEPSIANRVKFARILYLAKEYGEALNQIDEILSKDKSNLTLFKLKAFSIAELNEVKVNLEQVKEGLNAMNHYIANTPAEKLLAFDYLYLGKLQAKSGESQAAIESFSKSLQINPQQWTVYAELAKLYDSKKDFAQAVANYEIYFANAAKPTIVDYFYFGRSAFYGKFYGKADTAFQKVIELNKNYADAHYWRGNCLSGLDPDFKTDDAKLAYEKYIEMIGTDPVKVEKAKSNLVTAYSYLGYYHLNKDLNAQAKDYYKKVLELDPTNKNALEVLKQLK